MNAYLYRRDGASSRTTFLEGLYYAIAIVSVCTGWYFNVRYVLGYPADYSWMHFTRMLFANPASASAGQDMITYEVAAALAQPGTEIIAAEPSAAAG